MARSTHQDPGFEADLPEVSATAAPRLAGLDSIEELRMLADSFPGALTVLDLDLRVVLAGGERLPQTGYPREAMEGRTLEETFGPAVGAAVEPYYRAALAGERTSFDGELDGAVYRTEVAPLRSGGAIVGVVSIATDATERVAADRRVRDLNVELETILTQAPIGLALVDLDGGWIRVNARVCEIVGYSREELLTKSFQDITHPEDLQADLDNVVALQAGEIDSYSMEKRYFHKDGHVIWVSLSVGLIRDEGGEPRHFVSQIEDITVRKRGERYLEAERAVASALAEVPTVAEAWTRVLAAVGRTMDWDHGEAWLLDDEARVLVCAGTWSSDAALEDFRSATWARAFARGEGIPGRVWEEGQPIWVTSTATEPGFPRRETAREAGLESGVGLPLLSRGRTIGTIGFFSRRHRSADPELLDLMSRLGRQIGEFFARRRDEAERQALELRLLESQNRESLGVLAGGIAHDFNNLLVGVLGNASLLREDLPADSPLRELAEQIELAAMRAAGLTTQMLAYSGRGSFVVGPTDVSRVTAETVQLLRPALSKRARLEVELDETLAPVTADASQLGQLLMNLLTNAAEALGGDEGTLRVRTAGLDADRATLDGFRFADELEPGPYVLVEVADDGCGMSEEVVERMFEPYFSTKFTGRGLGLAASLGIIRGHRGALRIVSAPGAGTTVTVLLPGGGDAPEPPVEVVPTPTGVGTVLVVDDEEVVREVAEKALVAGGYTVLTAVDGEAALELFARRHDEIVCVVLDLTMPGLSGEAVLRALHELDPKARVVLSSGYAPETLAGDPAVAFLQKPYTLAELLGAVAAAGDD